MERRDGLPLREEIQARVVVDHLALGVVRHALERIDDARFPTSSGRSIVTSQGQNDSGLFDANLHDERYLPFEGQGTIGTRRRQLPTLDPRIKSAARLSVP